MFTPLIEASTEEDRPTVDEAKEAAAREQTVSIHGVVVSCATRRRWRVFEPLVQVEHACGLCLRSLAWLM